MSVTDRTDATETGFRVASKQIYTDWMERKNSMRTKTPLYTGDGQMRY